ncbi:ribosomal RNA processing protein 1 homolog [Neodiprion fabricii]|uniref:ribosomal RNA processing protein 1 homolog n=1 Tax=Neodiprion fabricii TaxID=2872261 RepID=UPI001ED8FC8A|nr:ribosomal RNA processing protein 1 homolog [Neodiprion fabricii]XP_046419577.1 ribosomal RNA processing protein 1 homolog [Neodiprion fabricii]XP_046419578.1 ribosomal RNA processing protein 1 homolog [Neodiprion fabricii]
MSVKKIQRKPKHVLPKIKRFVQEFKNRKPQKNEVQKSAKNKKTLVIAHEIKFAKLLAGNDKKVRDKVLKNLRKWLTVRSESTFAFEEQDFMRLWKGLYYCMWMSDKPLIQEELAESLSKLVHCFNNKDTALLYIKCTLLSLATEWFGIDQYRLDKFQMLVRRIIRQTFEMCKKKLWNRDWVNGVTKIIEDLLVKSKATIGFSLHVTELYMEELAKVSGGDVPEDVVVEFVRPFAVHLATMNDEREIRHVMKHVFRYLIFQSDPGLDYMEKFEAWRHAGFPDGDIESMQKVEEDESDEDEPDEDDNEQKSDFDDDHQIDNIEERPLDPRAGRVDVDLPQLPVNGKAIADMVMNYRFHPSSTTKSRRQIVRVAKEYNELSEGNMPLGIKKVKIHEGSKSETSSKSAAWRLLKFEQKLYSDTIRRKRKKKTSEVIEEDPNSEQDSDFEIKKIKSENATKAKKRNAKKSTSVEHISEYESVEANPRKVKSNAVESSKKRKRSAKIRDDGDVTTITDTPKKKKLKGVNKPSLQNGDSSDANKSIQNASKITKHKPLKDECKLSNPEPSTLIKKSLIKNGLKKVKRYSCEGNWSVSADISSTSPSISNLRVPTTSLQDNSKSVKKSQPNRALSWLTPVRKKESIKQSSTRISTNNATSFTTPGTQAIKNLSSSSSKKKVKIDLQKNTAQHTSDYRLQLKKSPAIPFDANRKPSVGVLKPSPIQSPVNPFYKQNFK